MKMSDPLELELQKFVSFLMWVLRSKVWTLVGEPSLQFPFHCLHTVMNDFFARPAVCPFSSALFPFLRVVIIADTFDILRSELA